MINLHAGGRVKSTARSAEKKRKNKIKLETSPDTGTSRMGGVLFISELRCEFGVWSKIFKEKNGA